MFGRLNATSGDEESRRMVNIAMMMTTGAEQGAMPHLPGTPAAGAAHASFHESFEGSVGAGLGKCSTLLETSANLAGMKGAVLRIGPIRVDGDETAGGAKMQADARETSLEMRLNRGKDRETLAQEAVPKDSEKEDSTQQPSEVVRENLSANQKVPPGQRLERSIALARPEPRSETCSTATIRASGAETAVKARPGNGKHKASSDAREVSPHAAGKNMLPDRSALSLTGQSAEPVATAAASPSIVQPVKDSRDEAVLSNVSATGRTAVRANKRSQSLKAPAASKEEPAAAGVQQRSVTIAHEDDGTRVERFHANDSSRSSGHGASAGQSEGTGKPHGAAGGEVQVMPLSPLMKEQAHTLTGSSAGRDVSVSGGSHDGSRSEIGAIDAPAVSASEHRALAGAPTMLEVGVPAGSHGWLKIRAELAGDGAVHASVSPSSAAGEEMLRRELPSLATYLHQEQVAVSSLVIHASAGTQDSSNMSSGSGESSAGRQQQGDAQHERGQREAGSFREWNEGSLADGTEENGIAAWLPQAMYAGSGGWLSVRA
jgi:hypothetical protein